MWRSDCLILEDAVMDLLEKPWCCLWVEMRKQVGCCNANMKTFLVMMSEFVVVVLHRCIEISQLLLTH